MTRKKIEIDSSGRRLAHWLGVAHRVGSDLCYWLLLESGKVVIARTTVQHVVRNDHLNDDVKREVERFNRAIEEHLSDQNFIAGDADGFFIQDKLADMPTGVVTGTEVDYGDMTIPNAMDDANKIDEKMLDKYLNAELIFDVGTGSKCKGRVAVKRAKGTSGEPIGRAHAKQPIV